MGGLGHFLKCLEEVLSADFEHILFLSYKRKNYSQTFYKCFYKEPYSFNIKCLEHRAMLGNCLPLNSLSFKFQGSATYRDMNDYNIYFVT